MSAALMIRLEDGYYVARWAASGEWEGMQRDLSVLVAELSYRGIHPDSIAVEVETAATRVEVAGGVSSQAGLASIRYRSR